MIKYKVTQDKEVIVTFNNGKVLMFPNHWTLLEIKYLAKHSKTFQYLYQRTANIGAIGKDIPSTEGNDTRRHFFYLAVRNVMLAMTRHGYQLDDLIKMEAIIMANTIDKTAIMEYALEKDIRLELADAVRYHNYR